MFVCWNFRNLVLRWRLMFVGWICMFMLFIGLIMRLFLVRWERMFELESIIFEGSVMWISKFIF